MPLNGSNTYRLTFDTAPPRNGGAFWGLEALDLTQLAYATDNIVLYSQVGWVVGGRAGRHSIAGRQGWAN